MKYCRKNKLTMSNAQFTIINWHIYLNIVSFLFGIELFLS